MVVVVCDGACGEATTLDLDDGLDVQLRVAGWSCAADGADLCRDCTRREAARSMVLERLGRHRARPRLVSSR